MMIEEEIDGGNICDVCPYCGAGVESISEYDDSYDVIDEDSETEHERQYNYTCSECNKNF
jgi:DNA-directed RNA polymerase subunit RPC12/RpoP